jgi:hypothetical protein
MKFTPGLAVGALSGSIGGSTASHNKGGAYFRTRVVPVNPNTTAQAAQRSRIALLATQWGQLLTAAQREAWAVFATNNPITDRLGQALTLTGAQAYSKINARLLAAGLSETAVAPGDQDVTDLLTAVGTFDIGVGAVAVTFTPTPLAANDHIQVFATPGLSPGVSFVKNRLRLIATSAAAEAGPFDFETAWVTKYGTLPVVGQKVVIECRTIRSSNGAVDAPLRSDMIVVST